MFRSNPLKVNVLFKPPKKSGFGFPIIARSASVMAPSLFISWKRKSPGLAVFLSRVIYFFLILEYALHYSSVEYPQRLAYPGEIKPVYIIKISADEFFAYPVQVQNFVFVKTDIKLCKPPKTAVINIGGVDTQFNASVFYSSYILQGGTKPLDCGIFTVINKSEVV
jgi:hypothetical protein